jgi:DNA-binding MarR family transcriptional regulator
MFERCLYFNTNALARKLNSIWEERFSALGLHPSHAYLLRAVLASPGISQQELAKELRLNKSTVTRFIEALEKRDLLQRKTSLGDMRERLIYPSSQALAMRGQLEAIGEELYASMCGLMGKDNLEIFVKTAREINEGL